MKAQDTGLEVPVLYHVYDAQGQWKMDDIFLDGISMTEDLQFQFDKMMQAGGADTMLQQMQTRLDSALKENAA